MGRHLRRFRNAARRLSAGLRLRAENVSPDSPNDLFRAHESIYVFASRFLTRGRVLDLGCGTGYGAARMRSAGGDRVEEVVGVDLDPRNVRFARRRFGAPGLQFVVGDAEALPESLGPFDLIVASNVLEHLCDVDGALDGLVGRLVVDGAFVAVVPPIVDAASLAENQKNPYHRTNLFVGDWRSKLLARFPELRTFRHLPPPGHEPDFTDPFPSKMAAEDFHFEEVAAEDLGRAPTLGAVFVCRRDSPDRSRNPS